MWPIVGSIVLENSLIRFFQIIMHEGNSRFDSSAERNRSILSDYENSLLIIMNKEADSSSDSAAERVRWSIIFYNNEYGGR